MSLSTYSAQSDADARRDHKAVFGIADRMPQDAIETELAVRLEDLFPSLHRARHRDGVRRGRSDLAAHALRKQLLGGHGRRRAA